jgi:hypothetical protein
MRRTLGGAIAAALLAGCGGSAGDLMALQASGAGQPGAPVSLVITNDGRARCGSGELREISSDELIEARELEREVEELIDAGRRFDARPRRDRRRYVVRVREGALRWVEGAPDNPATLARLELLALRLGRRLC